MTTPHQPRRRAAFTLIELLIVISIIAILAAAAIPVAGLVRQSANASRSMSNLRQLGSALSAYQAEHSGHYPAIEGDSKIPKLDNWVAELVVQLNPDSTVEELSNELPTKVFVSPGLAWPNPSGSGSLQFDEFINTYSATDCMVGYDFEDSEDSRRGRLVSTIERKPETFLIVEGQQAGGTASAISWIPWEEASSDLGGDADSAQSVDFRYRDRFHALMADMSAKGVGEKDAKDIMQYNWNGIDYPDSRR